MPRKKTNEEFIKQIYDIVGNEYTFLEEYVNCETNLLVRHNKCGREYYISPDHFISNGRRCLHCSNKINASKIKNHNKKTNKNFKKEIYNLVGDEYTFLEDYIDYKTKIKIKHNKCGYEYYVNPSNFISNNRRCPKCAGNMRSNIEEFKEKVYNLVKNEYKVLSKDYINNNTKIKMKHNKCGNVYYVAPTDFLAGHRCLECAPQGVKLTNEKFLKRVKDLVDNEYTLLEEYVNTHIKLKVRHNKCGNVYYVAPNNFINGDRRCPLCNKNSSKGEKKIKKWLEDHNIKYETQYIFNDCTYKDKLRFDFMIYNTKNEIFCLIEYDGIQHFNKYANYGKSTKQKLKIYKYTKTRDDIKDDYCRKNKIYLIHIPYTKYKQIDKILTKEILNYM